MMKFEGKTGRYEYDGEVLRFFPADGSESYVVSRRTGWTLEETARRVAAYEDELNSDWS